MTLPAFIAGDWGTSQGRFWLCDESGQSIEMRLLPGIERMKSDRARIESEFSAITRDWPGNIPAIITGMAGSNIGWRDAGYADCPFNPADIGKGAHGFVHNGRDIAILPGLKCRNHFGGTDLMRGEETQLAGAVLETGMEDTVFALPGTHNKWVLLRGGRIENFHTALTGEIFDILSRHSILIGSQYLDVTAGPVFEEGVKLVRENPAIGLETFLFGIRTSQIADGRSANEAASYMSGILIGCDIRSAASLFADTIRSAPVQIICNTELAELYGKALEIFAIESANLSGSDTVLRGIYAAWRNLR